VVVEERAAAKDAQIVKPHITAVATIAFYSGVFSRREFVVLTAVVLPRFVHAETQRFSALPAAFAQLERANGAVSEWPCWTQLAVNAPGPCGGIE